MPHPDPEELSLLALYEDWEDSATRDHLQVCPECAADFAALRRTVEAVKTPPETGRLEVPGPQVWAGIHRELGLSESVHDDPLAGIREHYAASRPGWAPGEAAAGEGSGAAQTGGQDARHDVRQAEPGAEPESLAEPVSLKDRAASRPAKRRSSAWWQRPGPWMAAAAAAVLVTAGAVWSLNQAPRPLAEADLAPLAQFSAAGSARVVESADGSRELEVRLSKDEAQGYQEVWLIAPDLSRLVSLGVMNSESGTFQLPAGLEISEYPIVDVSDEPVDGNPAHSSVSIARGTLAT
ncbi:anti-sigma factor [Arthrobacter sp. OY3WO11]|uniref:anti-sigma factor n=1 Tax=Arthrobacter sp. OY3WO11 TaxID=1835723 RepID=UPI0007CF6887|nr:anti-sigma factor [Arthrobacter sp. OY3WO11]OAE00448.1 anti-sigma factor [Arthrobacter sp. OY3WO11]